MSGPYAVSFSSTYPVPVKGLSNLFTRDLKAHFSEWGARFFIYNSWISESTFALMDKVVFFYTLKCLTSIHT